MATAVYGRKRVKQAEIDAGERESLTIEEREELNRPRRENRVLKKEKEVSKKRCLLRQGRREPVNYFRFIDAERTYQPVSLQCRMLGAPVAVTTPEGAGRRLRRSHEDAVPTERIAEIHL